MLPRKALALLGMAMALSGCSTEPGPWQEAEFLRSAQHEECLTMTEPPRLETSPAKSWPTPRPVTLREVGIIFSDHPIVPIHGQRLV